MQKIYEYIIIGAGIAAVSAAQGIREIDKHGSVLMIGDEKVPAYSRPMLTKTPLRSYELGRTVVFGPEWYQENDIELKLGTKVRSIDNSSRLIHTSAGESFFYKRLIYATGANGFVPPIPGADLPEVVVVRRYEDLMKVKRLSVDTGKAVIIGGGVIGLEAGFELSRYGLDVTVLEALPMLMPRFLDEDCARKLEEAITSFPVYTGVTIEEIGGNGHVEYVKLKDGRVFPCNFVIMSTGVRADIGLAQASGIKCTRSVMINEKCETSAKDIYACGDCAEYGINWQLWSQALEQGRVAGINAAGGSATIQPTDSSMIINSPEISMFSCGDVGKDPSKVYTTEVSDNSQPDLFAVNKKFVRSYEKRFYCDDKLVGAIIIGNLANMQGLKEEILGIKPREV
ncbi:MAG: NAD(P)/FAD-dependent oxidoreductase [Firmicutes bacterium]|nr:NAD(P)/FAD-dependent oxidoreductase [Bacillota bacterium]